MGKIKAFFNNKRNLAIVIFLLTVSIIIAVVVLIYTADKPKIVPEKVREEVRAGINEEIVEPLNFLLPSVSEAIVSHSYEEKSEAKSVQTNDWQVYRDEINGFQLKYPNDWRYFKSERSTLAYFCNGTDLETIKNIEGNSNSPEMVVGSGKAVILSIEKKDADKDLEGYIRSMFDEEGVSIVRVNKINNLDTYFVIDKGKNRFGGGEGYYYFLGNHQNNTVYVFELNYYLNQALEKELEVILKEMAYSFNK